MTTAEKLLTAEEFFLIADSIQNGRMELVAGRVRTMSPVGFQHGEVAGAIWVALRDFARRHRLGRASLEAGFVLARNPDHVLGPDVSFLRSDRMPLRDGRRKFIEGPPDLAVEVNSPNDRSTDVIDKVVEYLQAGGLRVWVVDPVRERVHVYHQNGDAHLYLAGDTLTSHDAGFAVEGFQLPVAKIFED